MQKNNMEIDDLYVIPSYVHNRNADTAVAAIRQDAALPTIWSTFMAARGFLAGTVRLVRSKPATWYTFRRAACRSMRTDPIDPLKFYTVNFQAAQPIFFEEAWSIRSVSFPFPLIKSIDDTAQHQRFMTLFERLHQNFLTGKTGKGQNCAKHCWKSCRLQRLPVMIAASVTAAAARRSRPRNIWRRTTAKS